MRLVGLKNFESGSRLKSERSRSIALAERDLSSAKGLKCLAFA
jgi:hypothetical protein